MIFKICNLSVLGGEVGVGRRGVSDEVVMRGVHTSALLTRTQGLLVVVREVMGMVGRVNISFNSMSSTYPS